MLPYHHQILTSVLENNSALVVVGKGLDIFEVVKQLAIKAASGRELAFIFGLSENEKQRVIQACANEGIEFLPKDIEKATGKDARSQVYSGNCVLFHSPGILAKDFLLGAIDALKISGLVIANAESIYKDPGLQLAVALFKSKNPNGYIRAFSERIYELSSLRESADLLWVRFILLYPRFELTVSESITPCDAQIISISLRKSTTKSDFSPVLSPELTRAFDILNSLKRSFVAEYEIKGVDIMTAPRRILESHAIDDDSTNIVQSALFIRNAMSILLHDDPIVFQAYLEAKRPSISSRPIWGTYPEVIPLYSAAKEYADNAIPSPKLQWIAHLISEIPDGKILILAEGSGTVDLICHFLSAFVPKSDSKSIEVPLIDDNEEPFIDPEFFGVIRKPCIILQEIHAQSDVFEKIEPDVVIFYDVTLLSLRRLEIYSSRKGSPVSAYLLSYVESGEIDLMKKGAQAENDTFMSCIKALQNLVLSPLNFFGTGQRTIIVDDREFRSGLPLALIKAGFEVKPALLIVGDYVISNETVVERKAYQDLVGSLKSGRLLQQIQRMIEYYPHQILLLEFCESDPMNSISAPGRNPQVMSKLLTIIRCFPSVKIVWGKDSLECAKALMSISQGLPPPDEKDALSMGRDNRVLATETRGVSFLKAIPFLSAKNIDIIEGRCKNLSELIGLSRVEMMKILEPSVGIKLHNLLHMPIRASQSKAASSPKQEGK